MYNLIKKIVKKKLRQKNETKNCVHEVCDNTETFTSSILLIK